MPAIDLPSFKPTVSAPQQLFSSEFYRVDYFPATADPTAVVVTFTERTSRNLDGFGFGGGFMLKERVALIAVKGVRDHWYQDFPEEALQAIRNRLNEPDLCHLPRSTYGSSMGAYAALAFSITLGANHVLALSPPSDILQPWDTRWRADVAAFRPISPGQFHPDTRIIIAFDPTDLDGRHAAMIAEAVGDRAIRIQVPYAGHPVTRHIHEAECLKPLALAVFRGEPLPDIGQRLKVKRRSGTHYLFILALRSKEHHRPRWAYSLVREALKLRPLDAEYNMLAAVLAQSLHQIIEATTHAALAVAVNPNHPGMLCVLADLLDQQQSQQGAVAWINQAIGISPHDPNIRQIYDRIIAHSPA